MLNFSELEQIHIDTLREVGSIGSGNAATALSSLLGRQIRMTQPEVKFMSSQDMVGMIGGPENIVLGLLVSLSGDLSGIMLYVQELDFINVVLESFFNEKKLSYEDITDMELSAIVEVGNIMIGAYVNSLSQLLQVEIEMSVPAVNTTMAGAILSTVAIQYGYHSDTVMVIEGGMALDGKEVPNNLFLVPDLEALSSLFKRLGLSDDS